MLNGFPRRNSILSGQHGSGPGPLSATRVPAVPRSAPDLTDTCPRPTLLNAERPAPDPTPCRVPIGQGLPSPSPIGPYTSLAKPHLPHGARLGGAASCVTGISVRRSGAFPGPPPNETLYVLIQLYLGQSSETLLLLNKRQVNHPSGAGKRRGY